MAGAEPAAGGQGSRHLALVGPTASGKSSVAAEVAATINRRGLGPPVEIVTVDSMQVYRGMDIGTAKPTPDEQAAVPHHLLDLVEPSEEFTLTRYRRAALSALADIESRGHRALLVGGTGLYFQALVDGLEPPGRYPQARADLEAEADTSVLYRRLAALDPAAAGRIDPHNRRRVVRALEVCVGSGRPFSSFGPGMGAYPPVRWHLVGLWLPRSVVAARIERRLQGMIAGGLVAETEALLGRPGGLSRTASQALGYRELVAYLRGGTTFDEAVAEAARRTRAFARRQRMWWRRDPRLSWLGVPDDPLAVVPVLLRDWGTA